MGCHGSRFAPWLLFGCALPVFAEPSPDPVGGRSAPRFAFALRVREVAAGESAGEETLAIGAARGEAESFLVIGDAAGLVPRIVFADFIGPGTIPATCLDVRLVAAVSCLAPEDPRLWRKRKWDRRRVKLVPQSFPDALVSPHEGDPVPGRAVFWVTVSVPRDARPGVYRGTVELGAAGKAAARAFTLEVWDFEVPVRTAFRLSAGGPRGTAVGRDPAIVERRHSEFASHHVSDRGIPDPKVSVRDGRAVVDWTAWDADIQRLLDLGMDQFQFPFTYVVSGHGRRYVRTFGEFSRGRISDGFRANWTAAVGEAARHLAAKGWRDRFFVNFSDEPYEDQLDETRALATLILQADAELKPACFGPYPSAGLAGPVKHWITHIHPLDPAWSDGPRPGLGTERIAEIRKLLAEERQKGNRWSVYNPLEEYGLASAPVEQRTLFWWCFGEGVDSMFQWTVHDGDRARETARDWDSTWVDVAPGGDLVRSVRWEMTRDGIEDFEYLRLLAERHGAEEAAKLCGQMVRSITDRSRDPRELEALRRRIGETLGKD